MMKLWMIVSAVVLFCLTTTTVSATGLRTHGGAGSLDGSMVGTKCADHGNDCSACLAESAKGPTQGVGKMRISGKCVYTVKETGQGTAKGGCAWARKAPPVATDICKDREIHHPYIFSPNAGVVIPGSFGWETYHALFPSVYTNENDEGGIDRFPNKIHELTLERYKVSKAEDTCRKAKRGSDPYKTKTAHLKSFDAKLDCKAEFDYTECLAGRYSYYAIITNKTICEAKKTERKKKNDMWSRKEKESGRTKYQY